MQRFDPNTDRQRRSEARLRVELYAVLEAAGADPRATYRLTTFDKDHPSEDEQDEEHEIETGDLEDVVFDIGWATGQALARDEHDPAGRAPSAGQTAVAVMVLLLRARLDDFRRRQTAAAEAMTAQLLAEPAPPAGAAGTSKEAAR